MSLFDESDATAPGAPAKRGDQAEPPAWLSGPANIAEAWGFVSPDSPPKPAPPSAANSVEANEKDVPPLVVEPEPAESVAVRPPPSPEAPPSAETVAVSPPPSPLAVRQATPEATPPAETAPPIAPTRPASPTRHAPVHKARPAVEVETRRLRSGLALGGLLALLGTALAGVLAFLVVLLAVALRHAVGG